MTIKQQIIEKIEESFLIAEKYYGRTFSRHTKIVWEEDNTRAGYCNHGRGEFGFNPILAEENADFIKDTVPHEVAHWIDVELYGHQYTESRKRVNDGYGWRIVTTKRRVMHGRTWKRIMTNVYRLDPERCHNYSVDSLDRRTRVVIKAFTYTCPCNTKHKLTAVRHNKIVSGKKKFICNKCKGKIYLLTAMSPVEIQMEKLQREITRLEKLNNKTKA